MLRPSLFGMFDLVEWIILDYTCSEICVETCNVFQLFCFNFLDDWYNFQTWNACYLGLIQPCWGPSPCRKNYVVYPSNLSSQYHIIYHVIFGVPKYHQIPTTRLRKMLSKKTRHLEIQIAGENGVSSKPMWHWVKHGQARPPRKLGRWQ